MSQHFCLVTQKNWKPHLEEMFVPYGHSIIQSIQNVEATQMSSDRWVDEQNVVYACNEILFSCKREGNSDTATAWLDLEDIMLIIKISQSQKEK